MYVCMNYIFLYLPRECHRPLTEKFNRSSFLLSLFVGLLSPSHPLHLFPSENLMY